MNLNSNNSYTLNGMIADKFNTYLNQDTVNKLLAIALEKGGDFADIYCQYSISNGSVLEENKIKEAQSGSAMGVGIRVISGEKTGYAFSESYEFEYLKKAAETASLIASGNNPGQRVEIKGAPKNAPEKNNIGMLPAFVETRDKIALLTRANETGYKTDSKIIQVITSFSDVLKFIRIANSDGIFIDNQESICRFNVHVVAEHNGKRQSGGHGGGGKVDFSFFESFTPEDVAKEAVRTALVRLEAKDAPAGPMEVVLGNGWAGILLHESVGHGLEADFNRKKTSLYSDRVGQKVASELVTVIDDGTIPNKRGTINLDDEGYEPRHNVLIENGILKGYLYDQMNARLMKTETTGSGRRQSFKHYPMPRMTNTFLAQGESNPDDIIKSVKKGLYAKSFGGGQVDISNGQFMFEVTEGYLIEDGKITSPVKGASLIGTGPEVLEKVVMVGNDFELDTGVGTCGKNGQSVPVGVGMPTVKISEITVGGTEIAGMGDVEGEA